jgi:hypothetical protein
MKRQGASQQRSCGEFEVPISSRQIRLGASSFKNCNRIIDLQVLIGFRSSHQDAPLPHANFGIGALVPGSLADDALQQVGEPHGELDAFTNLARARGVIGRAAQLVELAKQHFEAIGHQLMTKCGVLACARKVGVGDQGGLRCRATGSALRLIASRRFRRWLGSPARGKTHRGVLSHRHPLSAAHPETIARAGCASVTDNGCRLVTGMRCILLAFASSWHSPRVF